MSKKLEPLKIDDIIEVKEIKKLLSESKSKLVVIKSIIDDEDEEDILPELSDHSSDEDE